ncbi:Precorrin-2 dehydrogenase [Neobacillus rhizosphaerae]|uniref:precorrin-2 dehydrogenase n=1 Tax=Neobacillus rhizosphaerae TaxID=2880965 RepID=A0ABM9EX30_9BACI|nr:NAD(P)-binding protein [Neobacillus rhizosphaerae]CAH2717252.1 Precorrin-2 dehydrogenase [Neobacillus rhizosphaerae]
MITNYPIMLRLEGKKVVVVGGGKVAERKVTGLLETGARVMMISPEATDELKRLADEGKLDWQQRLFSQDDLKDAFLIFVATNDTTLNQQIKDSAGCHQLVTIADDPDGSDFHLPSYFQRGRLSIAVATGGASPMLARKIREQLEQQFDETYEEYLDFLFLKRQWILQEVADATLKRKLLTAIVSPEFLNSNNREVDFQQLYEKMI